MKMAVVALLLTSLLIAGCSKIGINTGQKYTHTILFNAVDVMNNTRFIDANYQLLDNNPKAENKLILSGSLQDNSLKEVQVGKGNHTLLLFSEDYYPEKKIIYLKDLTTNTKEQYQFTMRKKCKFNRSNYTGNFGNHAELTFNIIPENNCFQDEINFCLSWSESIKSMQFKNRKFNISEAPTDYLDKKTDLCVKTDLKITPDTTMLPIVLEMIQFDTFEDKDIVELWMDDHSAEIGNVMIDVATNKFYLIYGETK